MWHAITGKKRVFINILNLLMTNDISVPGDWNIYKGSVKDVLWSASEHGCVCSFSRSFQQQVLPLCVLYLNNYSWAFSGAK
jgi:hypothetical protein